MLVDYKDILYQWIAYTKHNLLQYLIHDKPRPQTDKRISQTRTQTTATPRFPPANKIRQTKPTKSNTEAKAQNKHITDINTRDRM